MEKKDKSKATRRKSNLRYYYAHRAERDSFHKEYLQSLAGRFSTYRSGATKRGYSFKLTLEEFGTFWQKPCSYCKDPIDTIGLDRIDNTKGYSLSNVVPCCAICNLTRQDEFSYDEMINEIGPAIARVKHLRNNEPT